MHKGVKFAAGATLSAAVAAIAVLPTAGSAHRPGDGHGDRDRHGAIRHVLLISVDGLHQSDLDWYVATIRAPSSRSWSTAAPSTPTRTRPFLGL